MSDVKQPESHAFQAEVSRLLHLMVHSVYSEKEVFLRELISNASDACDKLRYEAITTPALTEGDEDFRVLISIDKEARTLTLADNGVGMGRDELIENLGTIAKSGTGQFADQLTGDDAKDVSLIGQFGVGFYSAFMVAETVQVVSRRAGSSEIWMWSSQGTGEFTVEQTEEAPALFASRGTAIVMALREGEDEYLEQQRLTAIVKTYSDHVALPIKVLEAGKPESEAEALNTASALWARPKSDITDEQYKEFYHHVGHAFDDPWARIHYKAEGRHEYSVLLFVPSMRPMDLFDPQRSNRLKLYVNRIFITDDAPLLPGYLRFVRGVVDSEDMPLNISREMLQNNPIVTNIRGALTKRVLSELTKRAEKEPEEFEKFWDVFGAVIKEGLYEDFERRDDLQKLARFKTTTSEGLRSFADYMAEMRDDQQAIYYIAGEDAGMVARSPQLEGYKARGIEVLLLSDPVDGFWVQATQEIDGKPLKSVTQGAADLGDTSEDKEDGDEDKDEATLLAFMKQALEGKVSDVRKSIRLTDSAVCLVADEGGLDMAMEKILANHEQFGGASGRVLEVNLGHPLLSTLKAKVAAGAVASDIADSAHLLLDQARILEGDPVDDPQGFAKRMADVMARAMG